MDRSDISFICFELSVDYLCAVRLYSVLAGMDWKVGVALGRIGRKREKKQEEGASCYPVRDEPPQCCVSAYSHTQMQDLARAHTHTYMLTLQTDVDSQKREGPL